MRFQGHEETIATLSGYPSSTPGFQEALRYAEERLIAILGHLEDRIVEVPLRPGEVKRLPPGVVEDIDPPGAIGVFGRNAVSSGGGKVLVRQNFSPENPIILKAAAEFVSRFLRLPDQEYAGDRHFPEVLRALIGAGGVWF